MRSPANAIAIALLLVVLVQLLAPEPGAAARRTTHRYRSGGAGGRLSGAAAGDGKRQLVRRPGHAAMQHGSGGGRRGPAIGGVGGNAAAAAATEPYSHVFDVLSYGAVGDGEADDTKAFLSAWQEACLVDSAVFEVPQYFTFVVRPIVFSGPCAPNIVFQIDGNIVAPESPTQWGASKGLLQWMNFSKLRNMRITGSGVVNGNGAQWWFSSKGNSLGARPTAIRFYGSSNISVDGIRIMNSPQTHLKFDSCVGVSVTNISVMSPSNSPNTDGIHLQNTVNVQIQSSHIANGDDCISIQTGCSNLDIHDIVCDGGHGISIGGLGRWETQACVSNVTVQSVTIMNSQNGVRIKTWQGGVGTVKGVTFKDVSVENIGNPIIIDQFYCDTKGSGRCPNMSSAVRVAGVTYHNIRGTYNRGSPIHFACSDTVPCSGVVVSQLELLPFHGFFVDQPFCWNIYGASEMPTIPPLDHFCLHPGLAPRPPPSIKQSSSSSLDDACASY